MVLVRYLVKAWDIVAYTADADMWCTDCASARYGDGVTVPDTATDGEGNSVHPVFASDEIESGRGCAGCLEVLPGAELCCPDHVGDYSCDIDESVCCGACPSPDGDAYRARRAAYLAGE